MEPEASAVGASRSSDARWRLQALAFTLVGAAAFVSVTPSEAGDDVEAWLAAMGLGVVVALAVGLAVLGRLPRRCWLPVAWLFLIAVGLLPHSVGGPAGGVGAVAVLPPVWFAVHGSRRELIAAIGGIVVVWGSALVFVGAPEYPAAGWRGLTLLVALAALVGFTVQRIIQDDRALLRALGEATVERDRLLDELDELAHGDPLTGLPNRRAWERALGQALVPDPTGPVCVALIDLDGLKDINDRAGHAQGDAVLRRAASAWSDRIRGADLLARIGGDEFGLLLRPCDLPAAHALIERFHDDDLPRCSIGLVEWDGAESADELQQRADALLYIAKDNGRGCSVMRNPALGPEPGDAEAAGSV